MDFIKSGKDFFSGLMFIIVGGAFAIGAMEYAIGSGARMGPGYFPFILGILLAVLGVLVLLQGLRRSMDGQGDKLGKVAWRPLGFIIGANLLFGVLLVGLSAIGVPSFGLIVAIYALTVVAGMAEKDFSLKGSLVLATVLAAASYVAFVWLLNLQFPVWPEFIVEFVKNTFITG